MMAARLWRGILLGELALVAALALAGLWVLRLPFMWAPAVVLGGFLLLQWCSGVALLASGHRDAREPLPARELPGVALALAGESVRFTRAMIAMCIEPWRSVPPWPAAGPKRPVLLLHGLYCNRGVWRPLLRPLHEAGFAPVRGIDLEPLLADIATYVATARREILALQRECDGARVRILAHSMGGLIARAAADALGPRVIARIVTVATPHHGSTLARHLPCPPALQLLPRSSWLHALNASGPTDPEIKLVSIYSPEDALIAPAGSAALAGARLYALRGLGHFGLLSASRARACILSALTGE